MNDDAGSSRAIISRAGIEEFLDRVMREGKATEVFPSVNTFNCNERTATSGYCPIDKKDYQGQVKLEVVIRGELPRFTFLPSLDIDSTLRISKGRDYL